MTLIYGFESELLIGIQTEGEVREKRIEFRKSSGATETCMTSEKFATNHPFQYMGRVLSTLIDRIGEEEVFEPFRKSKFKKIPQAILKLPLKDMDLVYFLSHLHTHGPILNMGDHDCPECRKRNKKIESDLRKLVLEEARVTDVNKFSVLLETGFISEADPKSSSFQDYQNKHWNHYTFRPPTLEDAIRNSSHYSIKNRVNFNMRVYNDCLLSVESWDKEEGDACKVAEMEERHQQMEGMELFDTLDGRDRSAIRGVFLKLPGIDLSTTHECDYCEGDIEISVDPTNFHPLAKED